MCKLTLSERISGSCISSAKAASDTPLPLVLSSISCVQDAIAGNASSPIWIQWQIERPDNRWAVPKGFSTLLVRLVQLHTLVKLRQHIMPCTHPVIFNVRKVAAFEIATTSNDASVSSMLSDSCSTHRQTSLHRYCCR